ncbi:glyoxylate/hydroxypyruvate reductase A [Ottowia sp.]|uniref:2-hydroxyacid dehydrogenase n=1 Tax=Ottowia sp. TaxID=1898956 RepID=UPI002CB09F35|nr:glyoxylate/hydroxypyruvate reductase A [Ottowia sp.]HRN76551.1 glyoxylate/hydroxypyruvate reductase A [Ottowia sp.]HRQ03090.1 glyoxylate/hydroxypyruvate reductase A [Ottowia sp.]
MRILLCNRDDRPADAWLSELRQALPEAHIEPWQPGLPPDYDVALVWSPPQRLFDEQPQLKAVFNLGAGVDKLLALRLPPALQLLRLEDAGMAVQMAEYVGHALIRHFREFDHYQRQQQAADWSQRPLRSRADFPVGIMGLGVLGARVAQALQQFEFPLHGWSRSGRDLPGVRCFAGDDELEAFLAATRVLVCMLPLTPATHGILNRARLARLQAGAYLINPARGALVVEDDLRALLDSGHLAGATLDVMVEEPLPPQHWLWAHPRVTLTPHISGMTVRADTVRQVAEGVRALQRGEQPRGLVQRARGY